MYLIDKTIATTMEWKARQTSLKLSWHFICQIGTFCRSLLCCSSLELTAAIKTWVTLFGNGGDPGLSISQRSSKSLRLLSLISLYYIIMISTTEEKKKGTEIQALSFSYQDFPNIKCYYTDKSTIKNFKCQPTSGSVFTCSAKLSILLVPQLRHKHEKEPAEINGCYRSNIKQSDVVESELAKVVDLHFSII